MTQDSDNSVRDSGPQAAPALRRRGLRQGLLIAVAAAFLVAIFVGLVSRSKERAERRQTSVEGTGLVAVPSLIGVARDRALDALSKLDLEGEVLRTEQSCSKPSGTILRQDPAGMTQAQAGSRVRLVIAERAPIPIPEEGDGRVILAPAGTHTTSGRSDGRTTIEFRLVGDPCAAGSVTVSHPTAGVEEYTLEAGESGSRTRVYGAGRITIVFRSLNEGARLALETD